MYKLRMTFEKKFKALYEMWKGSANGSKRLFCIMYELWEEAFRELKDVKSSIVIIAISYKMASDIEKMSDMVELINNV